MCIIGNNCAGFNGKKDSLINTGNHLQAGIVMLQETKLYRKGSFQHENCFIFESLRGLNEGGGLLTMVHQNFAPVLIPMDDKSKMSENVLVLESTFVKSRVRYILGLWSSRVKFSK